MRQITALVKKSKVLIVIGFVVAIVASSTAFLSNIEGIQQSINNIFGIELKTPAQKERENNNKVVELRRVAYDRYEKLHANLFGLESYFAEYKVVVDGKINCYQKILGKRLITITGNMQPGPPPAPLESDASEEDKNIARLRLSSLNNSEMDFFKDKAIILEEIYFTGIPNDSVDDIKSDIKSKAKSGLTPASKELIILNAAQKNIDAQKDPENISKLISEFDKTQVVIDSIIRELNSRIIGYREIDDLDC